MAGVSEEPGARPSVHLHLDLPLKECAELGVRVVRAARAERGLDLRLSPEQRELRREHLHLRRASGRFYGGHALWEHMGCGGLGGAASPAP